MNNTNHYDVIVLGGGPAGLTAGIYLARAKTKALVLDKGTIGGQMVLTHEIANYPGIQSISGYMLGRTMKNQALQFGCHVKSNVQIHDFDLNNNLKKITLTNGEQYTAHAIIIASGGRSRTLGVPGEKEFTGRGISYCATCDGDFFQDKEIIVVGGGNSALEEAVALTQYASKVTIVHQFNHFQAYKHAVEEAQKNPKIQFIMESEITAFKGHENLSSAVVKNNANNTITEMPIDGTFIFIGYVPQTEDFKHLITLNQWGEIITDDTLATQVKGVFAAGDARQKKIRQVTTAVADGTIAALSAIEYIQQFK